MADLASTATNLRAQAERLWRKLGPDQRHPDYRGKAKAAAGRCYQTALWLKQKLRGFGVPKLIRGTGDYNHHFWVRVGGKDIDITGDQYGKPKVQVGKLPYGAGSERSWPSKPAPSGYVGAMVRADGGRANRIQAKARRANTAAVSARAEKIYRWWVRRLQDEVPFDVLKEDLRVRSGAPWVRSGCTRVVLQIGSHLVLKLPAYLGDLQSNGRPRCSDAMADEQRRWASLSRSDRAWFLPIIAQSPGRWTVMPLATSLLPRFIQTIHNEDEGLEEEIVRRDLWDTVSALPDTAGLDDIYGVTNWGMYRGRPVLLDYGAAWDDWGDEPPEFAEPEWDWTP